MTSSDMLERLYKLQADFLHYEQQEEAYEEDPDRDRPAPPDLEGTRHTSEYVQQTLLLHAPSLERMWY
jgi:hypothetical protein